MLGDRADNAISRLDLRVKSLSEQYIKLLEHGRTTCRFTRLMFRLLYILILLALDCAVVLRSYYRLYFFIALFSYSAFKAASVF